MPVGTSLQVWISVHFFAYSTFWPMSGQDDGVLGQCENLVADALQFLLVVAPRQVGTSYAHTEDSVACENHPSLRYVIAHSAWSVSRCVQYLDGDFAQLQY